MEPRSPALQVDSLPAEPPGKPIFTTTVTENVPGLGTTVKGVDGHNILERLGDTVKQKKNKDKFQLKKINPKFQTVSCTAIVKPKTYPV